MILQKLDLCFVAIQHKHFFLLLDSNKALTYMLSLSSIKHFSERYIKCSVQTSRCDRCCHLMFAVSPFETIRTAVACSYSLVTYRIEAVCLTFVLAIISKKWAQTLGTFACDRVTDLTFLPTFGTIWSKVIWSTNCENMDAFIVFVQGILVPYIFKYGSLFIIGWPCHYVTGKFNWKRFTWLKLYIHL